ncbi:MAG TPA: VTT domain-containing protein [Gemmataceae bacterium]|nr:VTT domain-containing protein [Gemmataceae bacterium]
MFDPGALWAYLSVFCLLLASGVGFPIPEEIPIVGAGVLVGHSSGQEMPPQISYAAAMVAVSPQGPFPANVPWLALALNREIVPPAREAHWYTTSVPVRWWLMLPVLIIGVVVCDGMLYGSGRLWGPWLLERRFMQRLLPKDRRQKIEKNFHDYGLWVLLFARLTPTIRAPIFIMAGVIRLPFSRFLLADGIYAIPGVSLLFWLGYFFGESFIQLVMAFEGRVAAAKPILILLLVAAVAVYFFFHFVHHPVATGDPRHEVPLIGDQVADKLHHQDLPAPPATGKPGQLEQPANASASADPPQNGPVEGPKSPQSADKNEPTADCRPASASTSPEPPQNGEAKPAECPRSEDVATSSQGQSPANLPSNAQRQDNCGK